MKIRLKKQSQKVSIEKQRSDKAELFEKSKSKRRISEVSQINLEFPYKYHHGLYSRTHLENSSNGITFRL